MVTLWKKLFSLLSPTERRRGMIVFLLLILGAFFEAVGVASVMPFIAVLANPTIVETNAYLAYLYELLGFQSDRAFLLFLGLTFFGLLVFSLFLRGIGTWAQLRFSHNRNYSWGARLVGGYLRQPYEWFLNRHSADLATNVLAEVNQVVQQALFPAMKLVANSLVVIFLMTLLIAVDPVLALSLGVGVGGSYAVIYFWFRKRLVRIGSQRREANKARFHVTQEAFGGVKDVKLAGLEETVVKRFTKPARIMAHRQISAGIVKEIPTLAIQGLLFGGMLLVLVYLVGRQGGLEDAIPVVSLYALAGYRLMPSIKSMYAELAQLKFSEAALDALCKDFATLQTNPPAGNTELVNRISLRNTLALKGVVYSYPEASEPALRDVQLEIEAFTTVGLVGSTGSGKTTTVDLILGLLRPDEGALVVDGRNIDDASVRGWQRSLGYVPQQIFLSDDTVAANIAFSLPEKDVDMAAVERAARIANLHDFVTREMPQGYQTKVGERGVRLSGGQRQRIGIARALYHEPDVLIMDEATSALDNITERAVMEAVHTLSRRKTIILIAHRLSTVRNCDRIFLLEKGEMVASGTYDELVAHEARFRAMTESA